MSYILTSRPAVAVIFRMLPATQPALIHDSGQSETQVREAIKLLLVSKLAYVSNWSHLTPTITAGDKPNVPRPSKKEVIAAYALVASKKDRSAYNKQYRLAHAKERAQYAKDNRERINATKRSRLAVRKALASGAMVVQDESTKSVWRQL